jgi:hypothetical protein
MALFSRRKSKEELDEDIERTTATKRAYRQAQTVEDLAAALLAEATKLKKEVERA